jgi:hypothetical protein
MELIMTNELEDELTSQERAVFGSLATETAPPMLLEQRTINALRQSGLIQARKGFLSFPLKLSYAAAACLLLFVFGAVLGAWWRGNAATDQQAPGFMLVLRQSPEELARRPPEELKTRVAEYRAWAIEKRKEGLLLTGEKLTEDARFVQLAGGHPVVSEQDAATKESMIRGYFLIKANDYQQALAIAETCPHLKYGGTVEVRQIQTTN